MKTIIRISFIALLLSLISPAAFAGSSQWTLAGKSQVSIDHGAQDLTSSCHHFNVDINDKEVSFDVVCSDYTRSKKLSLDTSAGGYQVKKTANRMTFTKFDYYGSKIQTANDKFHQLRVPYVKEIIRIEYGKGHKLSFYKEVFAVDSMGRVISESQLQAYGLATENKPYSKGKKVSIRFSGKRVQGS